MGGRWWSGNRTSSAGVFIAKYPKGVMEMSSMRRPLAALLAVLVALTVACSATSPTAAPGEASRVSGLSGGGFAVGAPAPAPESVDGAKAQTQPGGAGTVPVPQVFDGERALILTANVAMRSKDPWSVSDRVQSIALGLGGDVMSLAQSGSGDQRTAALTIRVPQARFNDALRQIRDISDVEVLSSTVEGKDVTDQFIDLEARLKAKQAEEQRYVALLARASTVEEILRIDQVLAQVRMQIEQLTAQLNSIKARTTFSTIAVHVSPLLATPAVDPGAYDPSRTLERAIASLASVLRVAADAAIWTLVFGWIPLSLLGVAMLLSRTRGRAAPMA